MWPALLNKVQPRDVTDVRGGSEKQREPSLAPKRDPMGGKAEILYKHRTWIYRKLESLKVAPIYPSLTPRAISSERRLFSFDNVRRHELGFPISKQRRKCCNEINR